MVTPLQSMEVGQIAAAIARGLEAAGSNEGGAMAGFMGMGLGMNAGGGVISAASNANQQQMADRQPAAPAPLCLSGRI